MFFYAVVVLYNKKIMDSLSVKGLLGLKGMDVCPIIIDNSDNDYIEFNEEWAKGKEIQYYSMGGNIGLSRAYNFALNLIRDEDGNDIVVWLDDDTPINDMYFVALREKAEDDTIDVFTPIIYGQDGVIYSPNKKGLFKGKYIKSKTENIPFNRFNAINSCLAVRVRVYASYSYDENLFLDCVDTKLFDDFRKMNLNFSILMVEIYQNFFQRGQDRDSKKYWDRFQIRIRDTVTYGSTSLKGKLISLIRIYGWAVVYGIKLRSVIFAVKCISLGTKLSIKNM